MPEIELRLIGPDRYCPDCKRKLLSIDQRTGTPSFVARGSILVSQGELDPSLLDEDAPALEIAPHAYCMRRLCRLKRWRRKEPVPPAPWENDPVYLLDKKIERLGQCVMLLAGGLGLVGIWMVVEGVFGR